MSKKVYFAFIGVLNVHFLPVSNKNVPCQFVGRLISKSYIYIHMVNIVNWPIVFCVAMAIFQNGKGKQLCYCYHTNVMFF